MPEGNTEIPKPVRRSGRKKKLILTDIGVPAFEWDARAENAVVLLVEGKLTFPAICEQLQISRTTLDRWRKHPQFEAEVENLRENYRKAILNHSIARQEVRIAAAQDRHERLSKAIDARREFYSGLNAKAVAEGKEPPIPGGETGLVYEKMTAHGPELRIDTETPKALLEHEKQVAQDLGQWEEKSAPTVAIQIVCPSVAPSQSAIERATVTIGSGKR